MELIAGKSYNIQVPNNPLLESVVKVHVEHILSNPVIPESDYFTLIVYRIWGKNKKRWYRFVTEYWHICMYNDWEYNTEDDSQLDWVKNQIK